MSEMIDTANANADGIKTTLTEATNAVGVTLSDQMNTVWTSGTGLSSIVTNYGNSFDSALTTTNKALASIEALVKSMVTAAQQKAASEAAAQAKKAAQATGSTATSSSTPKSSSNSSTSKSSSSSSSNKNFFVYKKNTYPKSKLAINSSIVDRLKYHDYDSSFSQRANYYRSMGGTGTYTGSASQNKFMINWMKNNGLYKGGEITDLIGRTKDTGFALVGTGETVITKQATQNLKDAIKALDPLQNIAHYASVDIPRTSGNLAQNIENQIEVQMNFPNAKNYEQIKSSLMADNDFEKVMQQAIVGNALGQNSLKKYSMIKR